MTIVINLWNIHTSTIHWPLTEGLCPFFTRFRHGNSLLEYCIVIPTYSNSHAYNVWDLLSIPTVFKAYYTCTYLPIRPNLLSVPTVFKLTIRHVPTLPFVGDSTISTVGIVLPGCLSTTQDLGSLIGQLENNLWITVNRGAILLTRYIRRTSFSQINNFITHLFYSMCLYLQVWSSNLRIKLFLLTSRTKSDWWDLKRSKPVSGFSVWAG